MMEEEKYKRGNDKKDKVKHLYSNCTLKQVHGVPLQTAMF